MLNLIDFILNKCLTINTMDSESSMTIENTDDIIDEHVMDFLTNKFYALGSFHVKSTRGVHHTPSDIYEIFLHKLHAKL